MRNDLQKRVTLLVNKGIYQINFDYYNEYYEYIGTIIVDELGRIEWHIINANYFYKISPVIHFLCESDDYMMLDYSIENSEVRRWKLALIYIKRCGYYINYKNRNNNQVKSKVKKNKRFK